jgi:uncharacterized protein (TIGR03083 family)
VTTDPALPAVQTAHLLSPIHRELVALLRGLAPEQWLRPTSAGVWRVRDVAAHLLDGQLRRLSFHRDRLARATVPDDGDYASVLAYVNALNADWIRVADRFSPRVLTDLLETIGAQAAAFLAALPPHAPAFWPVAWAGEACSENWMDAGRDYTEYWHHQQQIRDAVGAPALAAARWLSPVVALGVRALPPALAALERPDGAALALTVTGEGGGRWMLRRARGGWTVIAHDPRQPRTAGVTIGALAVARLWYSGRQGQAAAKTAACEGDGALCEAVLAARAVMV